MGSGKDHSLVKRAVALANGNAAYIALVAALVIHTAAFAGAEYMIGYVYSSNASNSLDPTSTAGTQIWMTALVVAPLALGYALITVGQLRNKIGGGVAAALAAVAAVHSTAIALLCAVSMVQPQNTWANPKPDTLRQFLGGWGFAVYSPLALTATCVAVQLYRGRKAAAVPEDKYEPGDRMVAMQPELLWPNIPRVVYGLVVLALVFLSTTVLSGTWNYSSPSYFPATSTYSLVQGVSWTWYFGGVAGTVVPKVYLDVVVYFSIVGAWIILGTVATYIPRVRRWLHHRVLFRMFSADYSLSPHGLFMSRGEALLIVSLIGLYSYWFHFWSWDYARIRNEAAAEGDGYPDLQIYARVMGHITTLSMSFLTFPVTRHSVWEAAFGVPFDRAVRYHRNLGRVTWLAVTAHALIWWIKWHYEGSLLNNVVTISSLAVSTPPNGVCPNSNCVHNDNFTVPLVEFSWLLLTVSLIIAQFFRRANYELFQYTHYAALLFMITATIHAWSHWYYTAVGLILYAFDKCHRIVTSSRTVTVTELTHASGITRLSLDASCLGSSGSHFAGQYVWLCVPSISPFQWHPFTIATAPGSDLRSPEDPTGAVTGASAGAGGSAAKDGNSKRTVTLMIKNMGHGTWTGQLAALAQQAQNETASGRLSLRDIPMSVDGPYGRPGAYYEHSVLVLVAGGIGITPIHAIVQDLYNRAVTAAQAAEKSAGLAVGSSAGIRGAGKEGLWAADGAEGAAVACAPLGHVRKVHLVWAVRDMSVLHAFAPTMLAVARAGERYPQLQGLFEVHVHLTASGEGGRKAGKGADGEGSQGAWGAVKAALCLGGEDDSSGEHQASLLRSDDSAAVPSSTEAGWSSDAEVKALEQLLQHGRPPLDRIFSNAVKDGESIAKLHGLGRGQALSTFVCGPAPLVDHTSRLALQHGCDYHSETFHF